MRAVLCIIAASFLAVGAAHPAFAQYDDALVVLETPQGQIVMEFFPGDAPDHVANFVELARSGFYDGTVFHRIIPGFMIQGGDPNTVSGDPGTWGTGGPGAAVAAEFNTIKHNRGIVSMARSADPDSAGSQFFIVHQNSNFLDQQYSVFGRIATDQSFETLDRIASVTTSFQDAPEDPEMVRILSASVVGRSDVPGLLSPGEPERVGAAPEPAQNQLYEDPELGIVFSAPPGWLLQSPQKTSEDVPDIVAVGQSVGVVTPVISLTVQDTKGMTLDEMIRSKEQMLEPVLSTGVLKIISQERSTVRGMDAYTTVALGTFETDDGMQDIKFKDIMMYGPGKLYTMAYSNGIDEFDSQLPRFEESVRSVGLAGAADPAGSPGAAGEEPEEPDGQPGAGDPAGGGGCLIATATFGSELAPQVQALREIRDGKVMGTAAGAAFMGGFNQVYYSFSPAVADLERQNPAFREAVKIAITPMLYSLSLLDHAEAGSEHGMLGWGLAVLMLNVGMYVAAPAVAISRIRR